ncbi:MAG: hypothetical protein K0U84_02455 [Actinomycetia bacterium]|nr:hypothetical protein [Actinomycetes bacterium]
MTRLPHKYIAVLCIGCLGLGAITACNTPPPNTGAAETLTPVPVSTPLPGNDCEEPEFSRQQFVGSWGEPDSPIVNKLDDDGTFAQLVGSEVKAGEWRFTDWGNTPAKDVMPEGAAHLCVIWLSLAPLDLVYRPLAVTESSIRLSYVSRGNTVEWIRKTPQV